MEYQWLLTWFAWNALLHWPYTMYSTKRLVDVWAFYRPWNENDLYRHTPFFKNSNKTVLPKQLPLVAWTFMWVSFHNPMTPCDSNQVHEWLATFKLLGPGAFVWWWPQPWAGVINGATNWVVMIIFGVGCAMNGSYEYAWLIEDWDLGGDLDEARLEHCRVFSTVLFQPSFWIIRCSGMSAFSRDLIDWVGTSPFSPCFLGPDLNAPDLTDRLLEVKNTKNISAKCYFMSWNKRKGSRYRIMHHG